MSSSLSGNSLHVNEIEEQSFVSLSVSIDIIIYQCSYRALETLQLCSLLQISVGGSVANQIVCKM